MFPQEILKLRPGLVAQYFDERNPAVDEGLGDVDQGGKGQGQVGIPKWPDGWMMAQDSQDPEMLVGSQTQQGPSKITLRHFLIVHRNCWYTRSYVQDARMMWW